MQRRVEVLAGTVAAVVAVAGASIVFYKHQVPVTAPKLFPAGVDAGYVDPTACAGCHRAVWDSYRRTGMGRSFARVRAGTPLDAEPAFFHEGSRRSYRVQKRDGTYYLRRNQTGFDGREINLVEKQIQFVIGSGNHARTYLHRKPNAAIVELPLAWYAENGGYWAMNPGYDRPNHEDFRRQISYECVFCHTGYPEIARGMDGNGGEPLFPGRIPEGIDCQRCHGPGRDHIRAAASDNKEAIRAAIVNPRRLTSERQLEVCMQCHLETTSRRLPHSVLQYDRGVFSYRPGEPLSAYVLHFDHAPERGYDDKFEIAHQAYRLRKSKCFVKSAGKLTCTTCHNPHDAPRGIQAVERYAAVCRTCHSASHMRDADCVGCHMPKRRTDDVVRVVMTDHYIQRRKPAGDLLAPIRERQDTDETVYHGPVVPYYPPQGMPELYVAVAQVKQFANLKDGIPRLRAALEQYSPSQPEPYMELAEACAKAGQTEDAVRWYRAALTRRQDLRPARTGLARTLAKTGQLDAAAKALQGTSEPDLGLIYLAMGRYDDAIVTFRDAVQLDPDQPEVFNNLAGALTRRGDIAGAEAAYREAIRLQPDFATANKSLADLLAARGDYGQAEFFYKNAAYYDPSSVEAHNNLGDMLALQGKPGSAVEHYRRALTVDPSFAPAHLGLGTVLAEQGKRSEAILHFRAAVKSGDPAMREQAENALKAIH